MLSNPTASRPATAALLGLGALLAGCAPSSPYLGGEAQWMAASPQARAEFVRMAAAEGTTLGDVRARYGPAEKYQPFPEEGTSRLSWYGEDYSYSSWVGVIVSGGPESWSGGTPILAADNSDGMRLAAGEGGAERSAAQTTVAAEPAPAAQTSATQTASETPAAASSAPEPSAGSGFPNPIRPGDVSNELAGAMAAFGRRTRATPQSFIEEFGPAAEAQGDDRLFASSADVTLYYGSGYGEGRNIWVHFSDGRYRRTMIHIPRGAQGPYERFF